MATATKRRSKRRTSRERALHSVRFPNEGARYRRTRDRLLRAELELRERVQAVAALRSRLPLGGALEEDYEFDEGGGKRVRLSRLFRRGQDTLVLYSFMFGPDMEEPCPNCASIVDALDATAPHATQRLSLAVVAKSPIRRIRAFARSRGWRNVRLLSSAHGTYNRDYRGEDEHGDQWPALNVFVRRRGRVHHFYAAELLFMPLAPGRDPCHVDMIWPLWNLLDLTPEGRGDFYPSLSY